MKALLNAIALGAAATALFAQTDTRTAFDRIKSLAGEWEGSVTTVPADAMPKNTSAYVNMRVSSNGNAVLQEIRTGAADDSMTVFYIEQDRLRLTHYCGFANRPRMEAKTSDVKTIDFRFMDISGGTEQGHMHDVVFTLVDADHHVEQWTYISPDGKSKVLGKIDLRRKKQPGI